MNKQSFLIIHGLGGSGPEHWQSWLYNELTEQNHHVIYPQFSKSSAPDKKTWMDQLDTAFEGIPRGYSLTVIAHSLGCFLWMHYAAEHHKQLAEKVILVAPPSPIKTLPEAISFFPVPLGRKKLLQAAEDTLLIHSTNDPYCSLADANHFKNLNIPTVIYPNAGHINIESGHGKWPWILSECMGGNRLNQKYGNN